MEDFREQSAGFSRRTVVKGAAWSVPVIAAAIATPLAAASTTDVGAFQLDGTCGALGLLGVGFDLTAGPVELPIGTTITVTTTGIANLGLLTATGGLADVTLLGTTGNVITLTAPLAAGATLSLRTVISLGVGSTLNAVASLPTGYVAGAGAKTTGSVEQLLVLCSAS